jgi:hypothetical protein
MQRLFLNRWLKNYFDSMERDQKKLDMHKDPKKLDEASASITQVKLSTQFQIGVDVAFGTNPFFPHPFVIIPFSGLNLDFNPSVTHKLDITLVMCGFGTQNRDNTPKEDCRLRPAGNPTNENSKSQTITCTQDKDDTKKFTCELKSSPAPTAKRQDVGQRRATIRTNPPSLGSSASAEAATRS